MSKNKILYEDVSSFENCKKSYHSVVEKINEFADLYSEVMEQPFTEEVMQQLISRNPQFEVVYREKAEEERQNIPSYQKNEYDLYHGNKLEAMLEKFEEVNKVFQYHHCSGLYLQEITIKDGKAFFTDKDAQRIKERYFTWFVNQDEETKKFAELSEKYVSAHNELNKFLSENMGKFGMPTRTSWSLVVVNGFGGVFKNDIRGNGDLSVAYNTVFRPKTYSDYVPDKNETEHESALTEKL